MGITKCRVVKRQVIAIERMGQKKQVQEDAMASSLYQRKISKASEHVVFIEM